MRPSHTMPRYAPGLLLAAALLLAFDPAASGEPGAFYELTLRNTNPAQNFSPPAIVLHRPGFRLFELGQPSSTALWRLAEEGETSGIEALADAEPGVHEVIVGKAVHRRNSPVFTTRLEVPPDLLVSVAAMLSLTNDGFVAVDSVPLPDAAGTTTTVGLRAYDAGSEANTELCAHVPCEVHGRRMTEGAEGIVTEHAGIRGDADIPIGRAWNGPELGTLTITRLR